MRTINNPKKALTFLFVALLGGVGVASHAEEAAAPPGILATYACNFNEGKDMDDLRSTRDYYVNESKKAGLSTPEAYVWSRFKGGVPFNHIWFDLYANLDDFAADAEEWNNADTSKIDARWNALEVCEANVSTVTPLFLGGEANPGSESTFVSSFACNFRDGVGQDEMADLESHIGMVLGGVDEYNGVAIFAATPMTQGPNSADVYVFSINASPTAWAAGNAALQSSPGGPSLLRHFNATLDCSASLWFAEQVVSGPE